MKRKASSIEGVAHQAQVKRRAVSHNDHFREGLFDPNILEGYTKTYTDSVPYAFKTHVTVETI